MLLPLLLIVGGTFAYVSYTGSGVSLPQVGSGTSATSQVQVEFAVSTYHQEQRVADFGWLTQMALKGEFWQASCYFFCSKGITYTLDPTALTQEGVDFIQCRMFGVTKNLGYTCSTDTHQANVIAVSGLSSPTIADTDTYAGGSGVACSSTNVVSTNGFILASPSTSPAVTVTAGTPASGPTTTTTLAVTYTATGSQTLTSACLLTSTTSTIYLLAEGTFGPDTLASGNTLTITWSMTST